MRPFSGLREVLTYLFGFFSGAMTPTLFKEHCLWYKNSEFDAFAVVNFDSHYNTVCDTRDRYYKAHGVK